MKVHFHVIIEAPEGDPETLSSGFSELLGQAINQDHQLGEDTHLFAMDMVQVLDDGNMVKSHALEASALTRSFFDGLSVDTKTLFFIRIPVEGHESHIQRFDMMDDVIRRIGGSPDKTVENVYFVFDTGWSETFLQRATELIFSRDPRVIHTAREEGITYSMWFDRASREDLLAQFQEPAADESR